MYKCKYCEKEFEKGYQLAAHISMCNMNPNYKENLEKRKIKKTKEELKELRIKSNPYKYQYKERKLFCKKCGKEYILNLTDKQFDSGKYTKFCSRSCANSRQHSEETKQKISNSVKNSEIFQQNNLISMQNRIYRPINLDLYYKDINDIPNDICQICGKNFKPKYKITDFGYKIIRHTKFCSKECRYKWKQLNFKEINKKYNLGGFKNGSVKNYKSGWYHGIHCDSSWELAFIIYQEEHGNNVERCKEARKYVFENKEHKYYPDFIINNVIYEIKGIKSKNSDAKQLYNPDIIFLFRKDMEMYLDYVIKKYGYDFIKLYDKKDK